jgi:hypothetical protein
MKQLKGQLSNSGYLAYNVCMPNGTKRRLYAHRLVASAYVEKYDNEQCYVNHKNGIKTDNRVENLEWVTPKQNVGHAVLNGLIKTKPVYCFDKNGNVVACFSSVKQAASSFGVSESHLIRELNAISTNVVRGHYWSYKKDICILPIKKTPGTARQVMQYNEDGELVAKYKSSQEAARKTGSNYRHIGECCRGQLKRHNGFVWKYNDDIV